MKTFNIRKLFTSIFLVLLTTVIFSLAIIASPQSERIVQNTRFDLNKTEPWKREYVLNLDIRNEDLILKEKKVEETKKVLFKRLNDYGVEDVTIVSKEGETPNSALLTVTVQSTKDITDIDRLVTQRFFMRIVTRKDGVDFNDEADPFVTIDASNYNPTIFTRRYFRSVYITDLDTVLGDKAYFAIFKPWFFRTSEFDRFIAENAAKEAGLSIDNIVTPITIPVGQATQNGIITKPIFAVGLSIQPEQVKVYETLMNSGVIPLEYSTTERTDLEPRTYDINHIEIVLAILTAIILTSVYFIIRKNLLPLEQFVFPTLLLWITWLSILKLFQLPVNTTLLLLQFMVLTPISYLLSQLSQRKFLVTLSIAGLIILIHIFGVGYVKPFTQDLTLLVVLTYPIDWFVGKYIKMSLEVMK